MHQNDKNVKNKNKIDLLKFQKNLNDQFLDIFNQKKNLSSTETSRENLGIIIEVESLVFFIELKDLRSIASKTNYETPIRTKSWLLGFNQEHGEVYTIFSLNKIISLIMNNISDYNSETTNLNSHIIYSKDFNKDEHYGFLINSIKLEDSNSFSVNLELENNTWKVFSTTDNNSNFSIVEKNIFDVIEKNIKETIEIKENSFINYETSNKYYNLSLVINKVYLNDKNKPIFNLNLKNIVHFIKEQTPY